MHLKQLPWLLGPRISATVSTYGEGLAIGFLAFDGDQEVHADNAYVDAIVGDDMHAAVLEFLLDRIHHRVASAVRRQGVGGGALLASLLLITRYVEIFAASPGRKLWF